MSLKCVGVTGVSICRVHVSSANLGSLQNKSVKPVMQLDDGHLKARYSVEGYRNRYVFICPTAQ